MYDVISKFALWCDRSTPSPVTHGWGQALKHNWLDEWLWVVKWMLQFYFGNTYVCF